MNSINYRPEGTSALDEKPSLLQLERAKATNRILEARAVMCDNDHNLIVDLGDIRCYTERGSCDRHTRRKR